MMELGKFSKKLHIQVSGAINNSNIDKVHVYGKHIRHTLNKIQTQKKGKIFNNKNEILNFIQNKEHQSKSLKNNKIRFILICQDHQELFFLN